MKKAEFTIRTLHNRKDFVDLSWTGYHSSVNGLIVCHNPYWNYDSKAWEIGGTWQLIHARSGYLIARHLERRKDAEALAVALGGVVDWTRSKEEIAVRETYEKVKEIRGRYI